MIAMMSLMTCFGCDLGTRKEDLQASITVKNNSSSPLRVGFGMLSVSHDDDCDPTHGVFSSDSEIPAGSEKQVSVSMSCNEGAIPLEQASFTFLEPEKLKIEPIYTALWDFKDTDEFILKTQLNFGNVGQTFKLERDGVVTEQSLSGLIQPDWFDYQYGISLPKSFKLAKPEGYETIDAEPLRLSNYKAENFAGGTLSSTLIEYFSTSEIKGSIRLGLPKELFTKNETVDQKTERAFEEIDGFYFFTATGVFLPIRNGVLLRDRPTNINLTCTDEGCVFERQ